MDPQQPSPWDMVLSAISQLRSDFKDDIATLNQRLDRLVTADVHQADIRRLDERITGVVADVGMERQLRAERAASTDAQLEKLAQVLAAEAKSRRDSIRWGVGITLTAVTAASAVLALIFGG